jgi:sugar lactone lactonase YvrE
MAHPTSRRPGKVVPRLLAVLALRLFAAGVWVAAVLLPARPRATIRPPEPVRFAELSPDGKTVATAPVGKVCGSIRLWDAVSGQERAVLRTRPLIAESCSFSPDNRFLVVQDAKGNVNLWDVTTGREYASLPAVREAGGVSPFFHFSPDGRLLVYADPPKRVARLWDADAKTERALLGPNVVCVFGFSPDGRLLATRERNAETSVSTMTVWNTTTGRPFRKFEVVTEHEDFTVAFAPDGKTLAAAFWQVRSHRPVTVSAEVMLWDLDAETLRAQLDCLEVGSTFNLYRERLLTFSPNGRVLAFGAVAFWDVQVTPPRRLDVPPSTACMFSPDGKLLAVIEAPHTAGEPIVRLVGLDTAQVRTTVRGPTLETVLPHGRLLPVAFAPRDNLLLIGGCQQEQKGRFRTWLAGLFGLPGDRHVSIIQAYDTTTGHPRSRVRSPCTWSSAQLSNNGRTLLTCCADGTLQLWDLPPRRPWGRIVGYAAIAPAFLLGASWLITRQRGVLCATTG